MHHFPHNNCDMYIQPDLKVMVVNFDTILCLSNGGIEPTDEHNNDL